MAFSNRNQFPLHEIWQRSVTGRTKYVTDRDFEQPRELWRLCSAMVLQINSRMTSVPCSRETSRSCASKSSISAVMSFPLTKTSEPADNRAQRTLAGLTRVLEKYWSKTSKRLHMQLECVKANALNLLLQRLTEYICPRPRKFCTSERIA